MMKKTLLIPALLCTCITLCLAFSACNEKPQPTQMPTESETEFICTQHEYNEWYTDKHPSCTEDGLKRADCKYCENYQTEVIPMGHTLTANTGKEPTCTEIGWKEYQTCAYCDYTTYEELPKAHKADESGACTFCQYILINTADDLQKVGLEGKYLLLNDIDLAKAEWTPIGTKDAPFIGEFNGNGHVIKNYKITAYREYLGFFGVISEYAKIEGLGIEEFKIETVGSSSMMMAGALIGWATGESISVKNCHASGEMKITTSCSDPSGEYLGAHIGGLIGYTAGSAIVSYCYTDVNMSVSADTYTALEIGGLSGSYHDWRIFECYSNSDVSATATNNTAISIGGLLGSTSGAQQHKMQNCYTTGSVYARSEDGDIRAGGIVGNGSALYCYSTCSVNASSVNGEVFAGGIVGTTSTFLSVSNCLATGAVISSGYAGGAAGMKDFTPGADGYISACYYIEPNTDHIQGDQCNVGIKATQAEIKTVDFFASNSTLRFDKEIWSLKEGTLPTLNCFAQADEETK